MKNIQGLELKTGTKEELLPDFDPAFPYIATCAELDKYIEPCVAWHWHEAVELFYIKSGCLEYTTPNGTWIFPAGSGGFVNSNVLHTSRIMQTERSNIQLLHLFEPSLISGEHGCRMEQKYVLPLVSAPNIEMIALNPNVPAQAGILSQICQAFDLSEEEWGYEFSLRQALSEIWLELFELIRPDMNRTHIRKDTDDKIKMLIVYIHEHFQEPISVDQLVESAHISKRTCFRLFQENLHMTPLEYIRSYRLQKACQMLTKSNEPITQIAYDCGLGSSSYFGTVFRKRFGCSPAQYRRKWHDRDSYGHI